MWCCIRGPCLGESSPTAGWFPSWAPIKIQADRPLTSSRFPPVASNGSSGIVILMCGPGRRMEVRCWRCKEGSEDGISPQGLEVKGTIEEWGRRGAGAIQYGKQTIATKAATYRSEGQPREAIRAGVCRTTNRVSARREGRCLLWALAPVFRCGPQRPLEI